jgi:hypothetical protein
MGRPAQRQKEHKPDAVEVELPRSVDAPRQARAVAAELCGPRTGLASLHRDLLLLVSEIVTNAVTHGGVHRDPFLLTAVVGDGTVRVTLAHAGRGFTRSTAAGAADEYGIYLLDRIASRWGVDRLDETGRTRVWFELSDDRYPYSDARRHRLAI